MRGGGGAGPAFGPAPFLLGGLGAAKGLLPCFLVPTRNQPTACTLALWWLKFGPTKGGGGGAWQSWPRGPAIGRGVAPFPRPPLPRAGFSRRPSLGPLIPRPLSRGAGRPGVAVRVSGHWLAGCGAEGSPPRSLSPPSLPREVARSHASCRTVGPARARGLGGGATARVNGGAQRAHHPSDRSVSEREGGGGGVAGALWSPGAAL